MKKDMETDQAEKLPELINLTQWGKEMQQCRNLMLRLKEEGAFGPSPKDKYKMQQWELDALYSLVTKDKLNMQTFLTHGYQTLGYRNFKLKGKKIVSAEAYFISRNLKDKLSDYNRKTKTNEQA